MGKTRKPSRRPIQTIPFNVRFTEAMAQRVRDAAHADDRDPTSWIREAVRKALEAAEQRRAAD